MQRLLLSTLDCREKICGKIPKKYQGEDTQVIPAGNISIAGQDLSMPNAAQLCYGVKNWEKAADNVRPARY